MKLPSGYKSLTEKILLVPFYGNYFFPIVIRLVNHTLLHKVSGSVMFFRFSGSNVWYNWSINSELVFLP